MSSSFGKNIFFLLTINLLVKPIWIFGIDRVVQNQLGEEPYGIYFSLMSLAMVLGIIQDVGLTTFTNRHIAQNEHLFKSYFPKMFGLKLVLASVSFLVVFGLGILMGYQAQWQLLFFILLNQTILSAILFVRANLGALHLFKKDSIISILDRLLLILIVGVFLYIPMFQPQFSLFNFILAQTIGYGITLMTALGFLLNKLGGFSIRFSLPFSVSIMKSSLPYALLFFLMYLYTRMDAIMLDRLHPNGSFEAGVYAKGYRILDAINMISYLFSVILLPMAAKQIKQELNISPLVVGAFKLLVFPVILGVLLLVQFKDWWMELLYYSQNTYQNLVFAMVIINAFPMALVYIFGTVLTSAEKIKFLNKVALGGFILNLTLNLILIPTKGAFGAAVATIITQGITAIIQVIYALKALNISLGKGMLYRGFIFLLSVLIASYLLQFSAISDVLSLVILLMFGTILLFMLNIISLTSIKSFFNK